MRIARINHEGSARFAQFLLDENQYELLDGDPLNGTAALSGIKVSASSAKVLPPVMPSKIIGIGDNYRAAGETAEPFTAPLTFLKPSTAVCSPGDLIVRPRGAGALCFEGELAVVIGKRSWHLSPDQVEGSILGYTIANDVTAQGWQAQDAQWTRAKGADTFCPLGPWIETSLTVDEASHLTLRTRRSEALVQNSSTALLKRGIVDLVTHLSQCLTLLPGDVILTGTPEGAGPMQDGDVIAIEIEGLGTLRNATGPEPASV